MGSNPSRPDGGGAAPSSGSGRRLPAAAPPSAPRPARSGGGGGGSGGGSGGGGDVGSSKTPAGGAAKPPEPLAATAPSKSIPIPATVASKGVATAARRAGDPATEDSGVEGHVSPTAKDVGSPPDKTEALATAPVGGSDDVNVLKSKLTPSDFVLMQTIGQGSFGTVMQVRYPSRQSCFAPPPLSRLRCSVALRI